MKLYFRNVSDSLMVATTSALPGEAESRAADEAEVAEGSAKHRASMAERRADDEKAGRLPSEAHHRAVTKAEADAWVDGKELVRTGVRVYTEEFSKVLGYAATATASAGPAVPHRAWSVEVTHDGKRLFFGHAGTPEAIRELAQQAVRRDLGVTR